MTSLAAIRGSRPAQIVLGLVTGIFFGFFLQKGGATDYGVIERQLLLTDFTVLKLMLSAVMVGMVIFSVLRHYGYANLHAADGTLGSNVIGGLIFGAGFAPFRGGPLNYARQRGIPAIVARLRELAARHGSRFAPDPGWERLA